MSRGGESGFTAGFPGAVILATLLAALLSASVITGAYTFTGQRWLLALTALLVLELIFLAPGRVLKAALGVPLAAVLGLLAAWTAASAIWTIGAPADAIRWAAVTLDYGVLAAAGAVIVAWMGPAMIGGCLAVAATVEGVIGAWAVALRHIPEAVLLSDSWRPGGNFEYAPGLTLLEVCALPCVMLWAASPSRWRAGVGGFCLIIFGLTFGTEDSRLPLALAVAAVILVIWKADPRLPRRVGVAAAILLALSAVVANLTLGRQDLGDHPGSSLDVVLTFVACVAVALAWPWLRRLVRPLPGVRVWIAAGALAALAVLAVGVWVLVGYTSTLTGSGGGLDHARFSYWTSAYDVFRHHIALGSGAETFFASASHYQLFNDLTLYAHDMPIELAAELGIPGFLLAVAIYLVAGRDLWRWLRPQTEAAPGAWLLAPAVGAFLIQNLFDWPWHFAALGAVWALAAGGLAAALAVPREEGIPPPDPRHREV